MIAIILLAAHGFTVAVTDNVKHPNQDACVKHVQEVLQPQVQKLAQQLGVTPTTTVRCSTKPL
jgi:ABC-type uncharacterized transport system substrate-binding protein